MERKEKTNGSKRSRIRPRKLFQKSSAPCTFFYVQQHSKTKTEAIKIRIFGRIYQCSGSGWFSSIYIILYQERDHCHIPLRSWYALYVPFYKVMLYAVLRGILPFLLASGVYRSILLFPFSPSRVCVLSSHLFWTSGLWTYQPGSHRKVTQDFSSIFLLRCLPYFLSREGFSRSSFLSRSFPPSTVKSNFVWSPISCTNELIVLHLLGIYIYIFFFLWGKIPVRVTAPGFEVTSQRQKVSRLP